MDFFRGIGAYLFPADIPYVAQSKYRLNDAIARLKAARVPLFRFQNGLQGSISGNRVSLSWTRINGSVWGFTGVLAPTDAGTTLTGTIGILSGFKFLLIGLICGVVLLFPELFSYPSRTLFIDELIGIAMIVVWKISPIDDSAKIADALDEALDSGEGG